MLRFEEKWYSCRLKDSSEQEAPDFSKVPEHKREMVKANWLKSQKPVTEEVLLWGPQVVFFGSQPYYDVEVIGLWDEKLMAPKTSEAE